MNYVDGYLIPLRPENREAYRDMSERAAAIFIDHGAIHVVETIGDDMMKGETTDFYRAVKAEDGETVVFSWITWPSKAVRDVGNKAAMADERFANMKFTNVFDGKRMIYSGFQTIVDRKA